MNDGFFQALGKIESGGNSTAFNKREKAVGIYQIRKKYLSDAKKGNSYLSQYKLSDCYNPEISKIVVISYLNKYCKNGSWADYARCHNSGPEWRDKKKLTNNYVARFNNLLKK